MIVHNEDYALRLATLDDVDTIATLTDLAYSKYVPRIGRQPQPMTTDYHDYVQQHPV